MLRRRLFRRLLPCGLVLLLLFAAGIFLAVKLPVALAPLAAAERLFSLCVALHVLARSPAECKPYRLFLLLLPWLGAVICLFLRRETPRPVLSFAPFADGKMNAAASLAAGEGLYAGYADGAEYFPSGRDMCLRLLADLGAAEREILLDYYILSRGRFFDTVLQILEKKAQSGVKAELVFDAFGCAGLPKNFAKKMRARGIATTVFQPLRPFAPNRLNLRDHRKLALIDRRIAYTGGVNLADEYIGERIRFGHWKDSAARISGRVCGEFARLFGKTPDSAASASQTQNERISCVPFADRAGGNGTGGEILLRFLSSAERSLELCTPYFVPDDRLLSAITGAARAGVKVRMMIPHIPDKKSVFLLTRHYARRLISAGAEVREYTAGFLHAKSLTADGKYALIGSYNLDRRSFFLQAECGVALADEAFCAAAVLDFNEMWTAGSPVPKETFSEKLLRTLLLPFAPWV